MLIVPSSTRLWTKSWLYSSLRPCLSLNLVKSNFKTISKYRRPVHWSQSLTNLSYNTILSLTYMSAKIICDSPKSHITILISLATLHCKFIHPQAIFMKFKCFPQRLRYPIFPMNNTILPTLKNQINLINSPNYLSYLTCNLQV